MRDYAHQWAVLPLQTRPGADHGSHLPELLGNGVAIHVVYGSEVFPRDFVDEVNEEQAENQRQRHFRFSEDTLMPD